MAALIERLQKCADEALLFGNISGGGCVVYVLGAMNALVGAVLVWRCEMDPPVLDPELLPPDVELRYRDVARATPRVACAPSVGVRPPERVARLRQHAPDLVWAGAAQITSINHDAARTGAIKGSSLRSHFMFLAQVSPSTTTKSFTKAPVAGNSEPTSEDAAI